MAWAVVARAEGAAEEATPGVAREVLQTITVTAQRREELLDRVPASVTALSSAQMDAQGIRTMKDVAQLTPGLTFTQDGYFPTIAFPAIRGISSNVGASTVGIYVDDTPIQVRKVGNSSANVYPQIFDVDRVEVLRGPQGTLFGAGAEGGAVRFISVQPSLTDYSQYARAEVSTTDNGTPSYEVGMAAGGPLVKDQLGFRVSGWYRHDGGWVDRASYPAGATSATVIDPNSNDQDSYAFRGALKWVASDSLTVTPGVFFQNLHAYDSGALWLPISDLKQEVLRGGWTVRQPLADKFTLPNVVVNVQLGGAELISNTAYFHRDQYQVRDYTFLDQEAITTGEPYTTLPGQNAPTFFTNFQRNITQELRLQSVDPTRRLTWLVGAFYSHNQQSSTQADLDHYFNQVILDATGGKLNLEDIFGVPALPGDIVSYSSSHSLTRQASLFGSLDYKLTQELKLTLGSRVSYDEFTYDNYAAGPYNGGVSTSKGSERAIPVTPRVVLSYQADDNNLFYGSASKGFRDGGAQATAPADLCAADLAALNTTQTPNTYSPDSTWAYEIGSKNTLLERRLSIDANAFLVDWRNIQQLVYLTRCAFPYTGNLGRARSAGLDLGINARPLPGLMLGVALEYVYDHAVETVRTSGGSPLITKNEKLGGPPFKGTLTGEYDAPLMNDSAVYLRFDYQYASRSNTGTSGTNEPADFSYDPAILPDSPTHRLNLRAGIRVNMIDVSLFADNVTNSAPIIGTDRLFLGSPLISATTFRPRTIGLTMTIRR